MFGQQGDNLHHRRGLTRTRTARDYTEPFPNRRGGDLLPVDLGTVAGREEASQPFRQHPFVDPAPGCCLLQNYFCQVILVAPVTVEIEASGSVDDERRERSRCPRPPASPPALASVRQGRGTPAVWQKCEDAFLLRNVPGWGSCKEHLRSRPRRGPATPVRLPRGQQTT